MRHTPMWHTPMRWTTHEVHAREMHVHEVIYAYEMIAEELEMKLVTVVSLLSAIGRISGTTCWFVQVQP